MFHQVCLLPEDQPLLRFLCNVYKVLVSQYDPLGFIIPYTTRGKILEQSMWQKEMGWDEPVTVVLRAALPYQGIMCHLLQCLQVAPLSCTCSVIPQRKCMDL